MLIFGIVAIIMSIVVLYLFWIVKYVPSYERILPLLLIVIIFFLIIFTLPQLFGRPIPLKLLEFQTLYQLEEEGEILSWVLKPETDIFILLDVPNINYPIYIVIPWFDDIVKKLMKHKQQKESTGVDSKLMFNFNSYNSLEDRERLLYEKPIPPSPPK